MLNIILSVGLREKHVCATNFIFMVDLILLAACKNYRIHNFPFSIVVSLIFNNDWLDISV